jgi:hypothetical protein
VDLRTQYRAQRAVGGTMESGFMNASDGG